MKTKIKILIAFVLLSAALLPMTLHYRMRDRTPMPRLRPKHPCLAAYNRMTSPSGAIGLSDAGPTIDSTVDATPTGAASEVVPSAPTQMFALSAPSRDTMQRVTQMSTCTLTA